MDFLSLDLDFWRDPVVAVPAVQEVLQFVRRRGIPGSVVMNHQQMLATVNASKARRLINIDEHSDFASPPINDLNCGTWVSYVKWRGTGSYLWIRNHKDSFHGACNGGNYPRWNSHHDWAEMRSTYRGQSVALVGQLTRNVTEVCICLSPAFTPKPVYNATRGLLKGLPYRRGVRDEYQQGRTCQPPIAYRSNGLPVSAPRI
jgi:hypothetical protein